MNKLRTRYQLSPSTVRRLVLPLRRLFMRTATPKVLAVSIALIK
jgi:hypothetical protein